MNAAARRPSLRRVAASRPVRAISRVNFSLSWTSGFTDLEAGLQTFLDEQGLGGLIELILTRLASDLVAAAILDHVGQRSDSHAQTEALLAGIEIVCRDRARAIVERIRHDGRFNRVDWFGAAGTRLGRELADSIVAELRAA